MRCRFEEFHCKRDASPTPRTRTLNRSMGSSLAVGRSYNLRIGRRHSIPFHPPDPSQPSSIVVHRLVDRPLQHRTTSTLNFAARYAAPTARSAARLLCLEFIPRGSSRDCSRAHSAAGWTTYLELIQTAACDFTSLHLSASSLPSIFAAFDGVEEGLSSSQLHRALATVTTTTLPSNNKSTVRPPSDPSPPIRATQPRTRAPMPHLTLPNYPTSPFTMPHPI